MGDPASNNPALNRFATTLASVLVGSGFFALWFWLLPQWLGFRVETAGAARWRWLAAIPSVLGFAVALRCIWDFGWTGRGTPAPIAPPQRLVVVGFYRYVRTPCTWASLPAGSASGSSSDTPTPLRSPPLPRSLSACTCSSCSTKNPRSVENSEPTTNSIAATSAAGGHVCTLGTISTHCTRREASRTPQNCHPERSEGPAFVFPSPDDPMADPPLLTLSS
jgi:hypothetical protein